MTKVMARLMEHTAVIYVIALTTSVCVQVIQQSPAVHYVVSGHWHVPVEWPS